MTILFGICAAVGGTILACQVVLTLIGLGGEAVDADVSTDVDGLGGDFDADMGAHLEVGAGADVDVVTADMDADVHVDVGHADAHADSTHGFSVLSFRSIVAALTFFGLAGLAAGSAETSTVTTLAVAVAAGAAAMYGVYWMMRGLYQLQAEGTPRIRRTVGKHATVYLKIPGRRSGTGKIQIDLQNRTMEYLAMTSGDALPTGAKVVVVNVVTPTTVEVEPVLEPERIEDA
jgi:hypothetical protein